MNRLLAAPFYVHILIPFFNFVNLSFRQCRGRGSHRIERLIDEISIKCYIVNIILMLMQHSGSSIHKERTIKDYNKKVISCEQLSDEEAVIFDRTDEILSLIGGKPECVKRIF